MNPSSKSLAAASAIHELAVIAARVGTWPRRTDSRPRLLLNLRTLIEGTLSEFFRFLSSDESLMVLHQDPPAKIAIVLIFPARERFCGVRHKNKTGPSDFTRVALGKLLENAGILVRGRPRRRARVENTREEYRRCAPLFPRNQRTHLA